MPQDCSQIGAISLRHVANFPQYLHTTDAKVVAYDLYSAKIIAQKQQLDTEMKQMLMAATIDKSLSTVNAKFVKI